MECRQDCSPRSLKCPNTASAGPRPGRLLTMQFFFCVGDFWVQSNDSAIFMTKKKRKKGEDRRRRETYAELGGSKIGFEDASVTGPLKSAINPRSGVVEFLYTNSRRGQVSPPPPFHNNGTCQIKMTSQSQPLAQFGTNAKSVLKKK
ncbi:hypothetical protein CHS0354_033719 [Potamilus streckersoni]|uniref:Uncharacterized protein n=1 Tax=Potamilus streckersoni TaxID=2493646 RepID=A0AAE0VP70_9BIVA|nr:hypothetical protein CHS0354_033719 [Potamilus streckersoni]